MNGLENMQPLIQVKKTIIAERNIGLDYHCPRCGRFNVQEYEKSIDCLSCQLEFEKIDLELFEDEDILAIEEKLAIIELFNGYI